MNDTRKKDRNLVCTALVAVEKKNTESSTRTRPTRKDNGNTKESFVSRVLRGKEMLAR